MMDKPTAQFFEILDEHPMERMEFYRSPAAGQWYGRLHRAAGALPSANWREWANDVVDRLQAADTAKAVDSVFLNTFENQMLLVWA